MKYDKANKHLVIDMSEITKFKSSFLVPVEIETTIPRKDISSSQSDTYILDIFDAEVFIVRMTCRKGMVDHLGVDGYLMLSCNPLPSFDIDSNWRVSVNGSYEKINDGLANYLKNFETTKASTHPNYYGYDHFVKLL